MSILRSKSFLFVAFLAICLVAPSSQPAQALSFDATAQMQQGPPGDGGDEPPPPLASMLYVSTEKKGRIGNVRFRDEDILSYNLLTDQWELYFDGSDVGVANADLNAFHIMEDGSILMSFDKKMRMLIGGQRTLVDDSDVVRFIPTQLGVETIGTFELFFTGSDAGLNRKSEDVDALSVDIDGNLLLSTIGTLRANNLKLFDEDVATVHADNTVSQLFDGSDIALSRGGEDISAIAVVGDWLFLSTKGLFQAEGDNVSLQGNAQDIILCQLISKGEASECFLTFFFDANFIGLRHGLDGLSLGFADAPPPPDIVILSGQENIENEDVEIEQFEIVPEKSTSANSATASNYRDENLEDLEDPELDAYDDTEDDSALTETVYLPLISGVR